MPLTHKLSYQYTAVKSAYLAAYMESAFRDLAYDNVFLHKSSVKERDEYLADKVIKINIAAEKYAIANLYIAKE